MMGSLIICTVIYILIALVLTGMVPYAQLGTGDPLAKAFSLIGMHWAAGIISFGAVVAMAAVLLVFQMGQPRIFFSMSRDGLLPKFFAGVHPKYQTPYVTTILTGVLVALFSAFANINEVVELCNIGTLFAFVLVCIGVIILRYKDPERHRPFKCPLVPLVPLLGTITCIYLMIQLPLLTWIRFVYWLLLGLLIYFLYGIRNSSLNEEKLSFGISLKENLKFLIPVLISVIFVTWYIGYFLGSSMTAYERIDNLIAGPDGKERIKNYISAECKDPEKSIELYIECVNKNGGKPLHLLKKPIPGLDKAEFLMEVPGEEKCLKMIMQLSPMGWKIVHISMEDKK